MAKTNTSMKNFLMAYMTNCKDATMLVIKHQENSLTMIEKIKMYFHVHVACKLCRLFYKQSNELHQQVQKLSKESKLDNLSYRLTNEEKSELQNVIEKESQGR
jgi:hypothetical protein